MRAVEQRPSGASPLLDGASRSAERRGPAPISSSSGSKRDGGAVARTLDVLKQGAEGTANTMPLILDCVKVYCTVGEISDAMRDTFGTYEEPAVF